MKSASLVLLLAAAVTADVSHLLNKNHDHAAGGPDANVPILKQSLDIGNEGNYEWNYETGNGIVAQERGTLQNAGSDNEAQRAEGSAKWTAPDGTNIEFSYVADENGYQPQGAHLPTPPPIPEAILRALEYIKQHPPQEEKSQ